MDNKLLQIVLEGIPNQRRANELMERLFAVARPDAVFSSPVTSGEYMVITASEVSLGLGFGYGGGGGGNPQAPAGEEGQSEQGLNVGSGGGGGGGGTSMARPVAVIEIGPHGVRVEPIMDPTKIALAFFTTLGAMFLMFSQMKKSVK